MENLFPISQILLCKDWVYLGYLLGQSFVKSIVFLHQTWVTDVKKWRKTPQDLCTTAQTQSCVCRGSKMPLTQEENIATNTKQNQPDF